MHVAFDAKRLYNNHTGLGNYSRTLVSNLHRFYPENQYTLFATETEGSKYSEDFQTYNTILPNGVSKLLWRSWSISHTINSENPDIYHGLSNELPFSSRSIRAKKIVTIHDLFFLKYPYDFTTIDRWIYAKKTKYACSVADHIIAISESTKADIIELLKVPEKKISVVYQSCADIFQNDNKMLIDESYDLPQRYFLFVGTLNHRKNLDIVLKAMANLTESERIPLLVVGGGSKKETKRVYDLVKDLKVDKDVVFLSYVNNLFLKTLYTKATATILLSHYEGFGIPIIESLFCGTPVIVSSTSALHEAAGTCGRIINHLDVDEVTSTLHLFILNEGYSKSLISGLGPHVSKFSAMKTSEALVSIYDQI